MSENPPPYNPSPRALSSMSTAFIPSWVWPNSSVVANIAVQDDDLRPRAKNVQLTLDAVYDIRFCESLFKNWMIELDKVPSYSEKPDGREKMLRACLERLNEWGRVCSGAANDILRYHVQFASLMAQRFHDASMFKYNDALLAQTSELAGDIRKASGFLSTNIERMSDDLETFVSVLERVQTTLQKERRVKKEQSLIERILGWLKSLFRAIATIFATLFPSLSGTDDRHHPDPNIRGCSLAKSALGQAASEFYRANSDPKKGKESESLDSVILFLKENVPREAQNAQKKLKRSDKALEIMERMREGQRVTQRGSNATAVAKEWRDVARQYQSAVERKK